jgi:hypothetical protein
MKSRLFVAVTQVIFVVIAACLIGSEFGCKIGIAAGLLGWVFTPHIG